MYFQRWKFPKFKKVHSWKTFKNSTYPNIHLLNLNIVQYTLNKQDLDTLWCDLL